MKIIFLNIKARLIEIYGETGVKHIPFSGVHRIKEAIQSDEDLLYITNAVRTNSQDVMKMVNNINNKSLETAIENEEPLYIRSTNRGAIRIEALKLEFSGPDDFKPLDDIMAKFGKNILEKDLTLRKLRESGDLEIVSQHDIKSVKDYLKIEKNKKQEKIKREEQNREGISRDGKDNEDMWSEKNPLSDVASSFGGGSTVVSESSLLPDFTD